MRPNWNAAPEWACYAAQELSGSWYFHELQPVYIEIVGEWRSKGRTQIVPKVSVQAKDTLEERPADSRCLLYGHEITLPPFGGFLLEPVDAQQE